jgi:hypothetical protein
MQVQCLYQTVNNAYLFHSNIIHSPTIPSSKGSLYLLYSGYTLYPLLVSLKTRSPGSYYPNILRALQGVKFIITGGILRRRDPKPKPPYL